LEVVMNIAMRALKSDLDRFVQELASISFLPTEQAAKALLSYETGPDNLPGRIQNALLLGDCVFVERLIGDRWQYSLQSGDIEMCSWLPTYLRSVILKPIANQLTPVGDGSQLVWCRMD
jgi:hypothetical protein